MTSRKAESSVKYNDLSNLDNIFSCVRILIKSDFCIVGHSSFIQNQIGSSSNKTRTLIDNYTSVTCITILRTDEKTFSSDKVETRKHKLTLPYESAK